MSSDDSHSSKLSRSSSEELLTFESEEDHLSSVTASINDEEEEPILGERGNNNQMLRKFSKWAKKTNWFNLLYLVDWCIAVVTFTLSYAVLHYYIAPKYRYIPDGWENETTWDYPYKSSTMPGWSLNLLSLIPISIVIATQPFLYLKGNRTFLDLHHGILGLFVAVAINFATSEILKLTTGIRRPSFKAMCNPDVATGECQNHIADAMKSFPSGHTSCAYCNMGFATLYLFAKLGVFRDGGISLIRVIFGLIPLGIATFVALTRLWDFKHGVVDVVTGAVIGLLGSVLWYFVYFKWNSQPRDRYGGWKESSRTGKLLRLICKF